VSEVYVADTMALILYLEKRRMPETIKHLFTGCVAGNCRIYVSSMSLAELGYLWEKGRIDVSLSEARSFFEKEQNFDVSELDMEAISVAFKIDDIPELHDRLIAGTASKLATTVITNDPDITKSHWVKSIWSK